eukprot:Gregarina_sp_Pseudo_9__3659@NODE_380_length_2990_cov_25_442562_g359_i0_p1_GENE_NODE_380_length_2990_cov_25_442562_g359_i0NODE_380_length_2990_cov_25_442562_g359_i0_p1_ORF_typecomplete_len470_score42_05Acyltransferase/PF01553_21/3_7e147TM_GPCR_Srt/PF10321_9/0_037_NODE_380_length_2990_cov_25_442562_g359_i015172926
MRMLLGFVVSLWVGSCFVCFILALRTWQIAKKKFFYEFSEEQRRKFYFLQRQDFNMKYTDIAELFVGSFLLFPFRAVAALVNTASILVIMMIFSGRCTLDITVNTYNQFLNPSQLPARALKDHQKQKAARSWLRRVVAHHCRFLLFLCGVTKIREFKVTNAHFDFPFEESKSKVMVEPLPAPVNPEDEPPKCVVSNHIAMLDIVYFIMRLFPSFIAKSGIVKHPIVGPCARALNCVFVNRSNVVDREKTIKIIGERQEEIWKMSLADHVKGSISEELGEFVKYASPSLYTASDPGNKELPPMVIFGEGTTTSGRTIMPLKRGAFLGLRPVSPCVLVYRCPQVHLAYDIFPLCWLAPLIFSSFRSTTLDVYWLNDVLPPAPHVGDAATRSIEFAQTVRDRMARVLYSQLWASVTAEKPVSVRTYPDDWVGSLASKRECLSQLFSPSPATPQKSAGSSSIVTTTECAVSLS